jgi:hypothetical protein
MGWFRGLGALRGEWMPDGLCVVFAAKFENGGNSFQRACRGDGARVGWLGCAR